MIETPQRRILAIPAANDPENGQPATVSIIDATNVKSFDAISFVALPPAAHLTPSSRVLLTSDATLGVVASSYSDPTLYSFEVETGRLISEHPLIGRPSEYAIHDAGAGARLIAVTSAAANLVTVLKLEPGGRLEYVSSFSSPDVLIDETNNPAFSPDGAVLYIAAGRTEKLVAADVKTGRILSQVYVASSPQRIMVAANPDGTDGIAVVRTRRANSDALGGVTIVSGRSGRLTVKSEFTPPEQIEFSRSNNPIIDPELSVGFVPSTTGILFAFSLETGELESHHMIGSELLGISLHQKSRTVAAVRRGPSGDEIVVVPFGVSPAEADGRPIITALKPDSAEQGRRKDLPLVVRGENFTANPQLLVNDTPISALVERGGKALTASLPAALFVQSGKLKITVRVDDQESEPVFFDVKGPGVPEITRLTPDEIPGPGGKFDLRISGTNFRQTSVVLLKAAATPPEELVPEFVGPTRVHLRVPARFAKNVGQIVVQIKDQGLLSNEKEILVFGPRIGSLDTENDEVIAGTAAFKLRINGFNFREGARVEVGGVPVPQERTVRWSKSLIRVFMEESDIQTAGKIPVVVRNPEGDASEPVELDVLAPRIESVAPRPVLAGTSVVPLNITGSFFRKHTRVVISNSSGTSFEISRPRVRFRSSTRVTVTLSKQLSSLIAQPGELTVRVINPNKAGGVPSDVARVSVVGPEISEAIIDQVEGEPGLRRLVIRGSNFRKGAQVEFLVSGLAFQRISTDTTTEGDPRRRPVRSSTTKLSLFITAAKLEKWGTELRVAVVNPGEVKSNDVKPRVPDGQGAVARQ
jgi:hypothetical protein